MLVAVLFMPVVAGNIFLESEFHRLPKITERNKKTEKTYMLFDPCDMKKAGICTQLGLQGDRENSNHFISPHNEAHVKCDMKTNGGGWTVIQRRGRYERLEDNYFNKTEKEYEDGFGDAAASYWIGNMNLHVLTTFPSKDQVLRIELTKISGEIITVEYDHFEVGSQKDGYKLTIGKYNGSKGYDAMRPHNKHHFMIGSTVYTEISPGCYPIQSGGWWYNDCISSNLNGQKFKSNNHKENKKGLGITWSRNDDKSSYNDIYKLVEMKIRDADYEFCKGEMAN